MKKQICAAALLITAGMVAGCGSSGSTSATPSSSAVTAVSGKVADGYLVNATVFMDKNGNYQLDAGEPSTTTDANGAYTLNVDPADIGKYPIIAMAVQGVTIDMDTSKPVSSSYLLSMPKDAVSGTVNSNFISPFSTTVREMMETGKYATMQQAMEAIRVKAGLPAGTNMMTDFVAGQNGAMHSVAQNMATVMGAGMSKVFGGSGSSSIDVNRYRGMMGTIFSNMSSLRGSSSQTAMTTLMSNMMAGLGNIPTGMPFYNMSSSFRGGMLSGTSSLGGSMMGSNSGGSMMSP